MKRKNYFAKGHTIIMRTFLWSVLLGCVLTGCMGDDEEVTYSQNSSILSFSLVSATTTYTTKATDGLDSTYNVKLDCTAYNFAINQREGLIYNLDSLPVGTAANKMLVNIKADTEYILKGESTDSIWNVTDTLDFTYPNTFRVLSYAGTLGRKYTVKVNIHQQDPDSLQWNELATNNIHWENIKACAHQDDNILIFTEIEGILHVCKSKIMDGIHFETHVVKGLPDGSIDLRPMVWHNLLYLVCNQNLYQSNDGIQWECIPTECTFKQFIAASDDLAFNKIIATTTDGHMIESTDAINWIETTPLPNKWPETITASVIYPLNSNNEIYRIVAMANDKTCKHAIFWTWISNENQWVKTESDISDPDYFLPNLESANMILYNDKLYAFGGHGILGEEITPFQHFYESTDHGTSWNVVTKKLMFPSQFATWYQEGKDFACTADNNGFIWFVWNDTQTIWRARINKLGFAQ